MVADSVALLAVGLAETDIYAWLEHAFYPALFAIFVIASLGVPIPEDLPLLAAGVLLHTRPDIASWQGAFLVSLCGIMSGDLILYSLGARWGDDVFAHRSVRWLISPQWLAVMKRRFRRYGMWMVFFGRFVVGIRAIMCLSAGVTRLPYSKFFLADLAGALITIPMFLILGYVCADFFPTLRAYLGGIELLLLGILLLGVGGFVWCKLHKKWKNPPPLDDAPVDAAGDRTSSPADAAAGRFVPDDDAPLATSVSERHPRSGLEEPVVDRAE